ncbi:MAG: hypothetical protein V4555_01025 [Acidobacteriota bacterium]
MATVSHTVVKAELRPAAYRERHALLQRLLWSRQFERSERLRSFLEYVTMRALAEPGVEVHEQELGCAVFERGPDYDTSADNIVRVSASQVRKKLEEYFTNEGSSEGLVLELPKGRYIPEFRERRVDPPTEPKPAAFAPEKIGTGREVALLRVAAFVLLVSTAALGGLLWRQKIVARAGADRPALTALWSSMFSQSQPTSIVVSDSSLSLYEDLLGRQFTLAEYLNAPSHGEDPTLASNQQLGQFARVVFGRGLTSQASTRTVYRIAEFSRLNHSSVVITRPKDFNMNDMKFGSVVLLGSDRANPWVELIENKLKFRYVYDRVSHHSAFQDVSPAPGQSGLYLTDSKTSFCRIAFLPNLSGNSNILNVAGTETEGTEGGGEYITNEKMMAQLRQRLGAGGPTFPYFEALLRSDRIGGATPQLTIVAVRLIQP